MKIKLTDEQFEELKSELLLDFSKQAKSIFTEILEDEYDIYSEISEHIAHIVEDSMGDNIEKVLKLVDKEKVSSLVAELLMDKLVNRW